MKKKNVVYTILTFVFLIFFLSIMIFGVFNLGKLEDPGEGQKAEGAWYGLWCTTGLIGATVFFYFFYVSVKKLWSQRSKPSIQKPPP